MILNAYDTTVGRPYKLADKVESTIKTLALSKTLKVSSNPNVLYLDKTTEYNVPVLAFPITTTGFNGKVITIYDERPFRNNSNVVSNSNELNIAKTCALLQQMVTEQGYGIVNSNRQLIVKTFTDALSNRLSMRAGLDPQEQLTLKILIAFYYTSIMLTDETEYSFVITNVIRSIYGTDQATIFNVINDLPKSNEVRDLVALIKDNPTLIKLHSLELKDLMAVISSLTFSALGGKVVAAVAEAPVLLMAMMWGAASYRTYNRTPLGIALDPKYNRTSLPSFLNSINYKLDLNY